MKRPVSVCVLAMLVVGVVAVGHPEEGLVVHYTFDEGEGELVHDRSGHGVDGQIVHRPEESPNSFTGKAEWVQEKDRKVLRFDGNTHIQAGLKANASMGPRGTLEIWCYPEEIRGGLISWFPPHKPGSDYWPEQSLVLSFYTYRDSRLVGVVANGVEATHSSWFLHVVEKGKWLHLAMTYDGTSIHIHENGKRVQTIPQDDISPNLKDAPLRIGRSEGLGYVNFVGRMAEVRIYNRALSAEELGQRFAVGVKQLGVELPRSVGVRTRFEARQAELTVLCDLVNMPSLPKRPGLSVLLCDANKKVLQEQTAPIPPNTRVVPFVLPTAPLTAGLYEVSVSVKDVDAGRIIGKPTTARWYLPEVADLVGAPPGRKVLNNLVTQLATVNDLSLTDYQEIPFVNPRKGWVFVSTTAQVANRGLLTLAMDAEKKEAATVHLTVDKPTVETMRFLSAGEHKLCLWHDTYSLNRIVPPNEKQSTIARLVVRAVPAMMYCGWPGSSYVAGYGEYGFPFLSRDVLPNINTLIGVAAPRWDPDRAEWKRRGGQYLQEQSIPTRIPEVLKDVPYPLTGDYAYSYWTKSPGFTHPYMDGAVEDEFEGGDDPNFHGYIEGVKRVAADPAFKDRALYMWCGPVMALSPLSRDFARTVIDSGYKLAWEDYLVETPTVEEASALFDTSIRQDTEQWERAFPGFPRHAILVLFISSAPPQSANINPSVDYKVFLDMQYQHLATSPECFGLWGVMVYKATYAEEEALRWAGRLFRHYCIEGNTDLLSERYGFTYNLRHIRNPDLDEGLKGWQAAAAERGSLKAGNMRHLHGLLGRYHGKKEGDNFLLMKRSGKKPNRVSQDIVGLRAGRLYSMKMLVADYQDLLQAKSEKKLMAVSVDIKNVEVIPSKSFASEVLSQIPEAQYLGKTPPWMNYHRLLFRAKGPTARLTISDWANAATPGGPVGQETLVNFIEIQPYLED